LVAVTKVIKVESSKFGRRLADGVRVISDLDRCQEDLKQRKWSAEFASQVGRRLHGTAAATQGTAAVASSGSWLDVVGYCGAQLRASVGAGH
jgi:hypothetical protein